MADGKTKELIRRLQQAGRRRSGRSDEAEGNADDAAILTTRPPRSSHRTHFSFVFIQACIAILILVGFESVTSMGEEAKNAKRDIPRAVLLSLFIQGVVCYLIEYFAANLRPESRVYR